MKFFNFLCVFTLVVGVIAAPCVKDQLDIAFMVDTSFTADSNYSANIGSFVRNSVNQFYTGDQYLKVAVFKYGAIFDSSGFTPDLNNVDVNNLQPTSITFNLLGAIQAGIGKFSQLNGARLSSSKILVVVTGATLIEDYSNVILPSFQSQQVDVIVVGVGHPSFSAGLNSIAHSDGVVVLGSSGELATSTVLANKFATWYPCGYCSSNVVCNGGSCLKGLCECISGYTGEYCTLRPPADECISNPCNSPCACVASCRHERGYYCVGPDGHLGKTCQIEPPQLHCRGNSISIDIPHEFVLDQSSSNDQMYLYLSQQEIPYSSTGDQRCKVSTLTSSSYYSLSIPVPFTECGTTKSYSAEGVIGFSNIVWLNHYGTTTHDIPVPVVEFTCYYNGSYQVLSTIRPVVDDVRVDLQDDLSTGTATVELCKITSSCLSACPPLYSVSGGAVYTIAQYINLRFATHNEHQQAADMSSIKAVIVEMFLTCESNSETDQKISVIADGCPTPGYPTRIHFNGKGEFVCVSFKVPRVSNCQGIFYIHAKLVQMHIDDIGRLKECTGVHNRKKRSIHSDGLQVASNETKHISIHNIGPIYVLEEENGQPETDIFPDAGKFVPAVEKVPGSPPAYHSTLVISCIISSIFIVALLFAAIIWKVRSSK